MAVRQDLLGVMVWFCRLVGDVGDDGDDDGVSAGIWVIHTEVANLGVKLFGGYSYDGVSAGIWVIHTEVANLGVTLFGGYSYDGVSAMGIARRGLVLCWR